MTPTVSHGSKMISPDSSLSCIQNHGPHVHSSVCLDAWLHIFIRFDITVIYYMGAKLHYSSLCFRVFAGAIL
ncbi:hypothetical protein Hanom_Chr13g01184121 [Helianthus anomalus]